ncbi:hypothetical protein ACO0RG_001681 [Hanseniaspora osmophila]
MSSITSQHTPGHPNKKSSISDSSSNTSPNASSFVLANPSSTPNFQGTPLNANGYVKDTQSGTPGTKRTNSSGTLLGSSHNRYVSENAEFATNAFYSHDNMFNKMNDMFQQMNVHPSQQNVASNEEKVSDEGIPFYNEKFHSKDKQVQSAVHQQMQSSGSGLGSMGTLFQSPSLVASTHSSPSSTDVNMYGLHGLNQQTQNYPLTSNPYLNNNLTGPQLYTAAQQIPQSNRDQNTALRSSSYMNYIYETAPAYSEGRNDALTSNKSLNDFNGNSKYVNNVIDRNNGNKTNDSIYQMQSFLGGAHNFESTNPVNQNHDNAVLESSKHMQSGYLNTPLTRSLSTPPFDSIRPNLRGKFSGNSYMNVFQNDAPHTSGLDAQGMLNHYSNGVPSATGSNNNNNNNNNNNTNFNAKNISNAQYLQHSSNQQRDYAYDVFRGDQAGETPLSTGSMYNQSQNTNMAQTAGSAVMMTVAESNYDPNSSTPSTPKFFTSAMRSSSSSSSGNPFTTSFGASSASNLNNTATNTGGNPSFYNAAYRNSSAWPAQNSNNLSPMTPLSSSSVSSAGNHIGAMPLGTAPHSHHDHHMKLNHNASYYNSHTGSNKESKSNTDGGPGNQYHTPNSHNNSGNNSNNNSNTTSPNISAFAAPVLPPPQASLPGNGLITTVDNKSEASGNLQKLYKEYGLKYFSSELCFKFITDLKERVMQEFVKPLMSPSKPVKNTRLNQFLNYLINCNEQYGVHSHVEPFVSNQGKKLVLVCLKNGKLELLSVSKNLSCSNTFKQHDLVIIDGDRGNDLGLVLDPELSFPMALLINFLKKKIHFDSLITSLDTHFSNDSFIDTLMNNAKLINPKHYDIVELTQLIIPSKQVLRFAIPQEVTSSLYGKFCEELKALKFAQAKLRNLNNRNSSTALNIRILNAEFQFDKKKLTFYYVCHKRNDFRELIKELFKFYKTRIWLCAIPNNLDIETKYYSHTLHEYNLVHKNTTTQGRKGGADVQDNLHSRQQFPAVFPDVELDNFQIGVYIELTKQLF